MGHEQDALAAWRNVSSKLCGETHEPVNDEAVMTGIVDDFCNKYPEMVNFQNNHAVNHSNDAPYGYFGYSPLITFAGAQACRRRRGRGDDDMETRKGSLQSLLRH